MNVVGNGNQHDRKRGAAPAALNPRKILITGGAGFIGSNLAQRLLTDRANRVCILDNLSRPGVSHNLAWLRKLAAGRQLEFIRGDVRDKTIVSEAARDVDEIYHFAAQVAVTTSIEQPRDDYEINVGGTFNVLEAARASGRRPFILFTSTNKVYGALHRVPVVVQGAGYRALDPGFRGVAETEPLDFHSPYGCSKGAADQYVHDYARIYDLPAVIFRMSCIAGPRQFGTEDQGWVAHFIYSVLEGKPITIYGDGFQVRDVLHVSDLIDAMQVVRKFQARTAGQIYNVGGGIDRAISVVEMLQKIAEEIGLYPILRYGRVRPGDQPLYVSSTAKLNLDTDWKPVFSCLDIVQSIHRFWRENRSLLAQERGQTSMPALMSEEVA